MPISLWLFVLTAVLFLLQLFPYTGIFLMIVAAPLWSIATINLGFMCMALEALIGRIPKWLVLVPLAYIVLYLVAADRDQRDLAQLRQETARQNDVAELPFDQSQHDLVVESTSHGTLNPLITRYGLRVGFEKSNSDSRTALHRAFRLADQATCTRMRNMSELSSIQVNSLRDENRIVNDVCSVSQPLEPVKPTVVITTRETKRTGASMPATLIEITIQGPGTDVRILRTGLAMPLMPWPIPVIGCFNNSEAPQLRCSAHFLRQSNSISGDKDKLEMHHQIASTIAPVLRLVRTPMAAMKPDRDMIAALELQIESSRQAQQQEELTRLDALIASPTEHHKISGFYQFPLLTKRIDLIVSRAPQLVDALGQAMSVISGRDGALAMAQLVANLPAETFKNHGPRIAAHLALDAPEHPGARQRNRDIERRKRERPRYSMNALLTRSGDLGEAILPMLLDDISTENRRFDYAAILALCRMGAPLALSAAPRLTEILNTTTRAKNDAVHAAAFVTLLRLGLREAALADPDASATYQHKWYQQALDSITPDSPRSVCTTSHGRSTLPD